MPFRNSLCSKELLIGQAGVEPATSWSRTKRATNCATARVSQKKPVTETGFLMSFANGKTQIYSLPHGKE